ncbi:MAG: hypothetical protein GY765_22330, partial [bacterium]|nr:hypothetical protein [bacterium]
ILSEVDGTKITSGNYLQKLRNDIFRGRKKEALIKGYRNGKVMLYKMVKESQRTSPPDSTPPSASASQPPSSVMVCTADNLKIRKSAPDTVRSVNRWRFKRKRISIKRSPNQQVFVAGDSAGTAGWGVDDQLVINGKRFKGLTDTSPGLSGTTLASKAKRRPLEITHLVPSEKNTTLNIELVDHGILWGNTDIFIVVK